MAGAGDALKGHITGALDGPLVVLLDVGSGVIVAFARRRCPSDDPGCPDPLGEWGIRQQLAEPVDRCSATECGMRSLPVEEGLPLGQLVAEARAPQVGGGPEFLQGGA